MKYKHNNVPLNTPVYATAYSIDDENLRAYLKCEPILGEVIDLERYEKEIDNDPPRFLRGRTKNAYINGSWTKVWDEKPINIFMPYKSNTKTFRKNGVSCESRDYADTYEEAIENYNDDVRWRIERLQKLIEEAKQDFIKQDKG